MNKAISFQDLVILICRYHQFDTSSFEKKKKKIRSAEFNKSETEYKNVSFSRNYNNKHKMRDDRTHKNGTQKKKEILHNLPKIPEEIWTKCMEFSLLIYKVI